MMCSDTTPGDRVGAHYPEQRGWGRGGKEVREGLQGPGIRVEKHHAFDYDVPRFLRARE